MCNNTVFACTKEDVKSVRDIIVNCKATTGEYTYYEFETLFFMYVEEADMEADMFTLIAWNDGRIDIHSSSEDYYVYDDVTHLFEEPAHILELIKKVDEKGKVRDDTEDYKKFWEAEGELID